MIFRVPALSALLSAPGNSGLSSTLSRPFIDVYQEGDDTRYLLIEQPEGKPLSRHQQVDAHPTRIVQSKYFKYAKPATVYHYDKQTKQVTRVRGEP